MLRRRVLRATRSQFNQDRWHCDLECGHARWVTSKRKPKRTLCVEC